MGKSQLELSWIPALRQWRKRRKVGEVTKTSYLGNGITMYPKWIQSDFDRGCRCTNCKASLSTANIMMVGVRCPSPWSRKPLGMYLTLCRAECELGGAQAK